VGAAVDDRDAAPGNLGSQPIGRIDEGVATADIRAAENGDTFNRLRFHVRSP